MKYLAILILIVICTACDTTPEEVSNPEKLTTMESIKNIDTSALVSITDVNENELVYHKRIDIYSKDTVLKYQGIVTTGTQHRPNACFWDGVFVTILNVIVLFLIFLLARFSTYSSVG